MADGQTIRDRLRGLERRELVGVAVVAVVVVAGAAFWYVRSLPAPVRVDSGLGPTAPGPPQPPSPSPTQSPGEVVVHVAGWVVTPGVYTMRQGDRVIDALERAGGARTGADLRSINLAAVLVDGQQIVLVKQKGKLPSGVSGGPDGGGPAEGDLVNLNTATLEQLETLPGIGEVLGQRILDYREEHGPFGSVDDLLNVPGIGEARLADLRPRVTV